MNSIEATVTAKGQVTIPKELRDRMGLEAGSTVVFREENGEVTMEPRYQDPKEELERMREEIRLSEKEIEQLQEESRESWSRDLPG